MSEFLESLRFDDNPQKIPKISTKRAAKSSLTKYDLTAVSLAWTIFQTRHTTNNIGILYIISLYFASLALFPPRRRPLTKDSSPSKGSYANTNLGMMLIVSGDGGR